ncbi:cobalt-zinc-cadmium efflux system protein [Deinobacterium chartae]|uniref:Cobalt-zinc-cadmium efflux system protein n=1 Tax=Deinobacterium chartae TaxID=521158 RepID=A0A841I5T4_9DEIO|nr:cation diffusion facilitator family transporter [Deinobacterium chartae]MBB6099235.1 cobalt-zinc-cadmium efflux system protein [Deinobacterium chartae]
MAHSHDHNHDHNHAHGSDRRRLGIALGLTATLMVAEIVGGLASGSLALLSDAGHMASDAVALILSLTAAYVAARPASARRSYGWRRSEVLAALANAAGLLAVTAWILLEAAERLRNPHPIEGGLMLGVAVAGLLANAASAWVLHGGHRHSLNVRGAFLHVIGDLLGSVGAIIAALVVLLTSYTAADPIISVLVALLIARSAWTLLKEALEVLMESSPKGTDPATIRRSLEGVPGVRGVHDLHLWSISSGFPVMTAHLELHAGSDASRVLRTAREILSRRFGLTHVTLQLEAESCGCTPCDALLPPPARRAH